MPEAQLGTAIELTYLALVYEGFLADVYRLGNADRGFSPFSESNEHRFTMILEKRKVLA